MANKVGARATKKGVGATPFSGITHAKSNAPRCCRVLVCSVGFIVDCYDRLLL